MFTPVYLNKTMLDGMSQLKGLGTCMGSQPQKIRTSPKSFKHIQFCRAFYSDHFAKKAFIISSTNDGARVKRNTLTDITLQRLWVRPK